MRLRRETGDFQIVLKAGETAGTYEVNSIRPGLSAEDLIGQIIFDAETLGYGCVIAAYPTNVDGKIAMIGTMPDPVSLSYVAATGEITAGSSGL